MAKRFSVMSTWFLSRRCMTKPPPMRMGRSSRLIRNDLARTAALYSRAAMTRILRMDLFLHVRRGDANKNVVQRRPGQLEVPNRPTLHQHIQDLLRVRVRLQTQ